MSKQTKQTSREEQAKQEIGHTEIRYSVKWTLFVIGLLTLFTIPVVQACLEFRQYTAEKRETPWPQCFAIFQALPQAKTAYSKYEGSWIAKTSQANATLMKAIDEYEEELKADSFLTTTLRPTTQAILAGMGCGNEKCYIGRQGWLFYRPSIEYCIGPGFLNPQYLSRRANSGTEWQAAPLPDPRDAILMFHRQLALRGITLIVMPTPGKATIHPEMFSSSYEREQATIHNSSYLQFLKDLQAQGVQVCDVTETLAQYRNRSGSKIYLATDTHWRPEAMELAAAELARFIEENDLLNGDVTSTSIRQPPKDIKSLGDVAKMLKLPSKQDLFSEEAVTIHPVSDEAGMPWRPNSNAQVLLLGDSFANIYSLETMNWGSAAGLAEHLSLSLNRPVDTLLQNDNGAYATRKMLSRELAQGVDRLAGKKVVIWQFAARELSVGDWKMIDMTLKRSHKPADRRQSIDYEITISGTIIAKSAAPRAGQMPYANHIFTVDLGDIDVHRGELKESKIAVYLFSMRKYKNTPAFYWPIGKRVKLKLYPWKPDLFARYGRINRSESSDIELVPWWGEVVEESEDSINRIEMNNEN